MCSNVCFKHSKAKWRIHASLIYVTIGLASSVQYMRRKPFSKPMETHC